MATLFMLDKLAVMPQAEVIVTINSGSFTIPPTVPFTTSEESIDVLAGTKFAVMYNTSAPSGKVLQVFSIDEIITVV